MFHPDGTPMARFRQAGVQEVDIVSVVKPLTGYAVTVLEPTDIRYHMEKALYLALHGRPGPVWIDIPPRRPGHSYSTILQPCAPSIPPSSKHPPTRASLKLSQRRSTRSTNPNARCCWSAMAFASPAPKPRWSSFAASLDIPVEVTWLAIDTIADDDPLYIGRPGTIAQRGANFAIQNCDYLLSIELARTAS